MMWSWLKWHLVFALAFLPHVAFAGGAAPSFSLTPVSADKAPYFRVTAAPGQQLTLPLRISNIGDASGIVSLYPVDMTTGVTSGAIFENRTDPPQDVGTWLHIPVATLTLPPHNQQILNLQLNIPAVVRAGQHLGGIVAEQQPAAGTTQQGAQIAVQVRNAVAVEVTLPGVTNESLRANGVQMNWQATPPAMVLALQNDGTQLEKAQGTVQMLNVQGQSQWTHALSLDTLVPQTSIAYAVPLTDASLPSGHYTVALALTYGSGKQLAQRWDIALPHTISVPSAKTGSSEISLGFWQWLAIGFLLVFGLVGWFRPSLRKWRNKGAA